MLDHGEQVSCSCTAEPWPAKVIGKNQNAATKEMKPKRRNFNEKTFYSNDYNVLVDGDYL